MRSRFSTLNPELQHKLSTLLADLYPERASAVRVAESAGIDVGLVAVTDHALNNWHAILEEARKQERLTQLLAVVDEEYGENLEWCVLKRQLAGWPAPVAKVTARRRQPIGMMLTGLLLILGVSAGGLAIGQRWQSTPTPTAVATIVTPVPTAEPIPATFRYGVTVKDRATNLPIVGAQVRIEIDDGAPLMGYTDNSGYVPLFIPTTLLAQPGSLIIEADGYPVEVRNIDFWPDQLANEVRLTRE